MAHFKTPCPRCKTGTLFLEDDLYTRDVVCLQCGGRAALPRRRPTPIVPFADDELDEAAA